MDSAAARPPAMTRPVITNGSPATSGMESTTKSVRPHDEVRPLHDAVAVLVHHREEPGRLPELDPSWQLADLGADQLGEHREPGEGRVGRRREVQEEDEEEGPRHRGPRLPHRGRSVVARQDVGQARGAHHEAEGQRQEVPHADAGRHGEGVARTGRLAGAGAGAWARAGRCWALSLSTSALGQAARLELGGELVRFLLPERARLLLLGVGGEANLRGVVLLEELAVGQLGGRDA